VGRLYRAINTANAALDQAPIVTQWTPPLDPQSRRRGQEARFLARAVYSISTGADVRARDADAARDPEPPTVAQRGPSIRSTTRSRGPQVYAEANLPAARRTMGGRTKARRSTCSPRCNLTRIRDADSTADELAKRQAGDFAKRGRLRPPGHHIGAVHAAAAFKDVFEFANERNQEINLVDPATPRIP